MPESYWLVTVVSALGLLFVVGLLAALSQRRRAEEALRESEARFRSLSEMSSDFYWESDSGHRFTQCGLAGEASTVSKSHEGAQICRCHEEIPRLSPDEAGWQAHRVVLDAHQPFRALEFVRLGANGAEQHISMSGAPVLDVSGAFKGYFGVGTDVTDRKRAEQRLRELSQAVEQSPAPTVITDTHGRITYANPIFSEITGYSLEELIGKTPAVIKSDLTPLDVYEDLWRTIKSGRVWRGEMQNRKKSGELYWEQEIISSVQNERGEIVNYIAVKEDITERKLREIALRQEHVERLEFAERMAAGVAHEVKNPLTIVRLGIDYLAKKFCQESNQKVFDDVWGAIDRADNVVADLLDFSRQKQFARRPIDINQVIENAIRHTKHETERRNIEIAGNRGDPMPPIYADPDRLVQVFINLLSNAAQAIGRNGRIEVVTRTLRLTERDLEQAEAGVFRLGEPVVTADIRDNGPGVPPEHAKKLFQPFFTTKPKGEGTGLGLAVTRYIVFMHRGSIRISNRPEGGVSALLTFRVAREGLTNEEKANTVSR